MTGSRIQPENRAFQSSRQAVITGCGERYPHSASEPDLFEYVERVVAKCGCECARHDVRLGSGMRCTVGGKHEGALGGVAHRQNAVAHGKLRWYSTDLPCDGGGGPACITVPGR